MSGRTLKLVHQCTLTWDVTEADIRMMKKTTVEETVGTWEATLGEAAAAAARYQATVLQKKREWFEKKLVTKPIPESNVHVGDSNEFFNTTATFCEAGS